MKFTINGKTYDYTHNENGASSHDWKDKYALPYAFTGQYSNARPIYDTPTVIASFVTDYRAFDSADGTNIIKWSCTLPAVIFAEK